MFNRYSNASFRMAFTLIELLIVVAIIAILAAIAVPNFLEAQTRAKISRAKADMRTITTGLETYHLDNNCYPKTNDESWAIAFGSSHKGMQPTLERLTSPISYLTGAATFNDPFIGKGQYYGPQLGGSEQLPNVKQAYGVPEATPEKIYRYISRGPKDTVMWSQVNDPQKAVWYLLESCGPDGMYHRMGFALNTPARKPTTVRAIYDSTNGTVSRGSIWRSGGGNGNGDWFRDLVQATY